VAMMENLTVRETKIVTFLAKSEGYVSANTLADFLKVSPKTIYRDIVSIKKKVGNENLIKQSQGKGLQMDVSSLNAISRDHLNRQKSVLGMSVGERRKHLLILLLLQSPQESSIKNLSEYYYVGNASIVNDLKSIEPQLDLYHLQLIRSHKGTYIEGKEKNIRKLLMNILEYMPVSFQENAYLDRENYHYIFKEFPKEDFDFIGQVLKAVENMLGATIKDPYYINIFTHLVILIKRLRNGSFKANYEVLHEKDMEIKNEQIFRVAQYVISRIDQYIELKVPDIEVFYIYQYFTSCGIEARENFIIGVTNENSKEKELTCQLIEDASNTLQVDFRKDSALQQNLFLHMCSLLKRVQYDISISNPLLPDIKKEFPVMFEIVKHSFIKQKKLPILHKISDDEISYIVVYFQASLEKQSSVKRELIVCSSGIGTSHLLKTRVKNAFPQWEIVNTVSANHIAQVLQEEKIDFILTTIHINLSQNIPIVLVSALFNEIDILKVKNAVSANP